MSIYYPPYDDKSKEGPMGPPGVGFKLTLDGNYDMESKNLKHCKNPIDDQDVSTKRYVLNELENKYQNLKEVIKSAKTNIDDSFLNFVKETSEKIKQLNDTLKNDLAKNYLYSQDGHIFDAKDRRIGNVKDPIESKHVVNKRYLEKKALILKVNAYDADNKKISNVADPIANKDVVTKEYVDRKVKINEKKAENLLSRDNDGLYVPSLMKNGLYDFGNQRLTNVANPIINKDVATKEYVDSKNFYATIKEEYAIYIPGGYKNVKFDLFSSKLLESNLKLPVSMYMKINIYFYSDNFNHAFKVKLEVGNKVIIDNYLAIQGQHCSEIFFIDGKKNDVIKLSISPDENLMLKPYIHISKIEFL